MRRFIWKTVLVTLLASSWSAADAAILELTPTSQFAVQGSPNEAWTSKRRDIPMRPTGCSSRRRTLIPTR